MSAPPVYDFAILGGGCAGLSLAVHAAHAAGGDGDPSWIVLESRRTYDNDRTFCSWELEDHPFASAVTHRWNRGIVASGDRSIDLDWSAAPYACLPADRFYARALRIIDESPRVTLRRGARVNGVARDGSGVLIDSDGGPVRARRVFDARPLKGGPHAAVAHAGAPRTGALLQHFGGLHVRTSGPVFDASRVTLMEFDERSQEGAAFFYVLPFAPDEALVESTVFSSRPAGAAWHEARVREWLRARHGEGHPEVIRREHGVLPMTASVAPSHGPVTAIGTAAGWLRPSTGYSFATTQRMCRELVARLARDPDAPLPPARSRGLGFLDAVFLEVLSRDPTAAPRMFVDLFEGVAEDRLVRFLSDRPRALDVLQVVKAMPALPFLGRVPAATRSLRRRSA